ncbi:MAG: SUMF1/EgtB/PvdO family nonheme iron enzyme [Planctomycetes bacterium]|nr:SUMF1/EgtB/PvdO family nonheme iron enzyme [Planctomycetota bacterium]
MAAIQVKDIILGEIAVEQRLVDREMVDECVGLQERGPSDRPLGAILVEKGYLSEAQLAHVLRLQKERLGQVDPLTRERVEDVIFGQLAVKREMLRLEDVHAALREQARLRAAGTRRRLGQILVDRAVLTAAQVEELLEFQCKRILVCYQCHSQFTVQGQQPGQRLACPRCRTILQVPDRLYEVQTEEGELVATTLQLRAEDLLGDAPGVGAAPPAAAPAADAARRPGVCLPGERFGAYEIIEEITRGGMGIVYKARQVGLERVVALKVLLGGEGAEGEEVQRFLREARLVAKLSHPHIIPIIDVGEQDGVHYFTMEYVKGRTLDDLIKESPFSVNGTCLVVRDVAKALQYAHEHGVLHRDVKPANIMITTEGGRTFLMDFGLARQQVVDTQLTQAGVVLGTPAYMPPEQLNPEEGTVLGPTADVYALGGVMYRMLTGQPTYKAESFAALVAMKLRDEPRPVQELNPEVPDRVAAICMKCLERRPADRYAQARDMVEDINYYLQKEASGIQWAAKEVPVPEGGVPRGAAGSGGGEPRAAPAPVRPAGRPVRRARGLLGPVTVLLALAALGAGGFFRDPLLDLFDKGPRARLGKARAEMARVGAMAMDDPTGARRALEAWDALLERSGEAALPEDFLEELRAARRGTEATYQDRLSEAFRGLTTAGEGRASRFGERLRAMDAFLEVHGDTAYGERVRKEKERVLGEVRAYYQRVAQEVEALRAAARFGQAMAAVDAGVEGLWGTEFERSLRQQRDVLDAAAATYAERLRQDVSALLGVQTFGEAGRRAEAACSGLAGTAHEPSAVARREEVLRRAREAFDGQAMEAEARSSRGDFEGARRVYRKVAETYGVPPVVERAHSALEAVDARERAALARDLPARLALAGQALDEARLEDARAELAGLAGAVEAGSAQAGDLAALEEEAERLLALRTALGVKASDWAGLAPDEVIRRAASAGPGAGADPVALAAWLWRRGRAREARAALEGVVDEGALVERLRSRIAEALARRAQDARSRAMTLLAADRFGEAAAALREAADGLDGSPEAEALQGEAAAAEASARERWLETAARAEALAGDGDHEGARRLLEQVTSTYGVPEVVEEARRRAAALPSYPGMVFVPAGAFRMGSEEGSRDARPVREWTLKAYYIDRHELTREAYGRFLASPEATSHALCHPSEPRGKVHRPDTWDDPDLSSPSLPVVGVDWFDAWACAASRGARLPTEAEWERAARGTDGRSYPWGPHFHPRFTGQASGSRRLMPVGSFPDGVSPCGALDMAGNAAEWVADWYGEDAYSAPETRDPRGPPVGRARGVRGGAFLDEAALLCVWRRGAEEPGVRRRHIGFRCARDP